MKVPVYFLLGTTHKTSILHAKQKADFQENLLSIVNDLLQLSKL
jgi:hypothetical protein